MAKVELARIDSRLIHGQVITKWVRQTFSNKITIIDDNLAQDEFMKKIYVMAAPSNIEVEVLTVNEASESWKENKLGEGNIFILFKDVKSAYESIKKGLEINDLQIGGLGSGKDRRKVFGPISFNDKDVKLMEELDSDGVRIYLHQVPDEPKMEFKKALERYQSSIK